MAFSQTFFRICLLKSLPVKGVHTYDMKFYFGPFLGFFRAFSTWIELQPRGTDIDLDAEVIASGGLHVVLTYLPKDSRTERQIIGRTGRKGQPGSYRLVLCQADLLEQLRAAGEEPARGEAEIKGRRDAIEAGRIDGLKEALNAVLFQERLFRLFCSKLDRFRDREGNDHLQGSQRLDPNRVVQPVNMDF